MKLTDHTLALSDQLFDVDTLVFDDAQIKEAWLRKSHRTALYGSPLYRRVLQFRHLVPSKRTVRLSGALGGQMR